MFKTKVQFVAKGNTELNEKFINYLMKEGKKTTARRILKDAFEIVATSFPSSRSPSPKSQLNSRFWYASVSN